jgi:hypothetical protein
VSSFFRTEIPQTDGKLSRSTRKAHGSWPASAWCVVGVLFALNLVLGVFLVKDKIQQPRLTEASASPALDVPRASPHSELNPLPAQSSQPLPAPASVEAAPVPAHRAGIANPSVIASRHSVKAHSNVIPKSSSRDELAMPTGDTIENSSASPVRDPAASPAPNYAPPAPVASVHAPVVGVSASGEQPRKTPTAPGSGNGTSGLDKPPSANSKLARKVSPVRLPGIDKGWVPKTAVGPVSPKIEIVPRPPAEKAPNCGGDVYVPCPTLHSRP